MSWKATIISALSKGDLELALQAAMKVDPRELFSLLEDFPEDKNRTGIAMFLNRLGNLYWDAQMLLPAEKAFREALRIWSLPDQDPDISLPETAALLTNLGTLYSQMGELSEAERAFKKALKIRRELIKKNPPVYIPDLASTLNNLGATYLDMGRFSESDRFLTDALEIKRNLAEKDPVYIPDVAMILNNLGTIYCHEGRFLEAEKVFTESLRIRRILAEKNPEYAPHVAMTLNNLGLLYKDMQRFDEAEKGYKEALKIRRDLARESPEYTSHVAMTLNNLGLLYKATQRFFEAEKCFSEALNKYKTLANLRGYTFQITLTLNNLGDLYRTIGRFYEAETIFTEALKQCKELVSQYPVYTSSLAMTLSNLGLLYWDTKIFDKSERIHKKALEMYRILEKENPKVYTPHVAMTLNNLGALCLDRKECNEAEKFYREALRKYEELSHENPGVFAFHVAGILSNLGLLYKNTHSDKAERAFNEALSEYKRGASWSYAANAAYHLSQIKDRKLLETSQKLLELGILFSKEEKYIYAQKGEKEHIYRGLLEEKVSPFGVLEALRDPEGLSLYWDHVIPQEERERAQIDVEFQKKVVEDMLKRKIPSIRIVNLPEDVFFLYIQKIRDTIYFFVVNNDGVEKFIAERKFFTTGIKLLYLLRFQLRATGKPRLHKYVKKFEELAEEWYEILPRKLKGLIQEKNEIVFSPDYYCSFFPLEALQVDRNPLCMEKTVVRAASLHQFSQTLKRNPIIDTRLVIGNPWPGCNEKKLKYMLPSGSEKVEISFLQGAEEEAKTLKKSLSNTTPLLGQQATGERFLSEISRHSLIHFSGHGRLGRILFLSGPLRGFPPLFESKEFSDLRKAERIGKIRRVNMMEEWHPVTDLDLYDIPLKEGAVIFLNACETGQHKYAGGGYYQGLSAVFLKNGAHSVISSLTPLFDYHSKEFALNYYENLFRTHSVATALKRARDEIRNRYEAHIYWLPYVHYGSPL